MMARCGYNASNYHFPVSRQPPEGRTLAFAPSRLTFSPSFLFSLPSVPIKAHRIPAVSTGVRTRYGAIILTRSPNKITVSNGCGMNRIARVGVVAASVVIVCYAGIGHVLGRTPDDRAYKSLTVYGEVLQKIQSDYVDEPNMRLVTAGALHGLLESLDSESSYLTPPEYDEYKKKQQNPGTGETGLTLSKRFGYVIVISVLPDSPGTRAGIRSGDILESISGFTTREMSVGQAQNLLTGPVGTDVKVAVIRRGKATPEDVELQREKLAPAKIISQKTDPDILVLRLPSLDPGRAEELRARLMEAKKYPDPFF